MALTILGREALLSHVRVAAPLAFVLGRRAVSSTIKDKETAEEKVYFNKEEELQLRKLLAKMKTQADAVDKADGRRSESKEMSSLLEIVGKYKLPKGAIQELVAWRHRTDL